MTWETLRNHKRDECYETTARAPSTKDFWEIEKQRAEIIKSRIELGKRGKKTKNIDKKISTPIAKNRIKRKSPTSARNIRSSWWESAIYPSLTL